MSDNLRVLLYDLETSPNISYTWGTYQQDVIKVKIPRQIICFSWKWLGEKQKHVESMSDSKTYWERVSDGCSWMSPEIRDNSLIISKLHSLFCEADVTVGHNVEMFDDRRSNTEFARHHLKPPPPHRRVDTLKFARSKFDFNSNKLGDLGEFLGLGSKVKHPGFEMWEGCMSGIRRHWDMMKRYNVGDLDLLEKVYLELRPWMQRHPNMNAASGNLACPRCMGKNLSHAKERITQTGKKIQFQCRDCGGYTTPKLSGNNKSDIRSIVRFDP